MLSSQYLKTYNNKRSIIWELANYEIPTISFCGAKDQRWHHLCVDNKLGISSSGSSTGPLQTNSIIRNVDTLNILNIMRVQQGVNCKLPEYRHKIQKYRSSLPIVQESATYFRISHWTTCRTGMWWNLGYIIATPAF